MPDASRLLPRTWIIAAIVAGIVAAVAAFGILTVSEPEATSAEFVAEVQGGPPDGGTTTPCWNLRYAEFAAENPLLAQGFRAEAFDSAGKGLEEAADLSTDELQVEALELFGQTFRSDSVELLTQSTFDLEAVVVEELNDQAIQIDPADAITAVIDLC